MQRCCKAELHLPWRALYSRLSKLGLKSSTARITLWTHDDADECPLRVPVACNPRVKVHCLPRVGWRPAVGVMSSEIGRAVVHVEIRNQSNHPSPPRHPGQLDLFLAENGR
jgi:hypothetical protein